MQATIIERQVGNVKEITRLGEESRGEERRGEERSCCSLKRVD